MLISRKRYKSETYTFNGILIGSGPSNGTSVSDLKGLNDLEGHSPVAGLFKCNPSNICAAFYQISTGSVFTWSLSDSWAFCPLCDIMLAWY